MLKTLFIVVVVLHGLIHLLGFLKAFHLAALPQLTGEVTRPAGVAWLGGAVLFLIAAVLFALGTPSWWIPAAGALILSQPAIILSWHDAKFGTLPNIIVLIAAVTAFGAWRFDARIAEEFASFFPAGADDKKILTEESIAHLPPVVRRWLGRSGAVGREIQSTAHFRQEGRMQTAPDGRWMPFFAEQWNTTASPGFFWRADVEALPGVTIYGRDKFQDGHGSMLIQLFGLVTIVNASGQTMDQGTILRYLAEVAWFPSAAVRSYIRWEEIDSLTAKATITTGALRADATYHFSPEGDPVGFEAMRYYDRPEGATLEHWLVELPPDGFREFDGMRIPAKAKVTWKLAGGDFTWLTMTITDARYNRR